VLFCEIARAVEQPTKSPGIVVLRKGHRDFNHNTARIDTIRANLKRSAHRRARRVKRNFLRFRAVPEAAVRRNESLRPGAAPLRAGCKEMEAAGPEGP
jgi:hypothetical protein